MNNIKLYNDDAIKVLEQLIADGIKIDAVITDIPTMETQANWDKLIDFEKVFILINELKRNETTPIVLYGGGMTGAMLRLRKDFKYKWYINTILKGNNNNAKHQPLRNIEEWLVFYDKKGKYNPQLSIGESNHQKPNNKSIGTTINQGVYGKSKVIFTNLQKDYGLPLLPEGKAYKHPSHYQEFRRPHPSVKIHQSEKPIELMEFFIKTYTNEGDVILDFTMGGGSTGIAAKKLNRKFIGIEINKIFFNIASDKIWLDKIYTKQERKIIKKQIKEWKKYE